jgi:hypothetical protein
MTSIFDLESLKHPEYSNLELDWLKWRRTYEAGDSFIDYYLEKFSARESDTEFQSRKDISYVPAFAAAAVDEVKDSIFQRISDVTRKGGSVSYNESVDGLRKGVDLAGTTMNSFVGRIILPELCTMKRVGVFVDMPELNGDSLVDQLDSIPYIYHYKTEDIVNWAKDPHRDTFTKLLLRDWIHTFHEETGLPNGYTSNYRLLSVNDEFGLVDVTFFDSEFNILGQNVIKIPEIPFVAFELPHSLLKNIANYQIALLNLSSSDIAYALKSNFPFYIEQFDPRVDNLYRRPQGNTLVGSDESSVNIIEAGERADAIAAKPYEVEVGTTTGRRIPMGLEMPEYIHPSPEPLLASMRKQEELKKDIRILVKLNVASLTPKMASGESKSFDERSLEAGLSAIALELEHGERRIAKYWQWYEDRNGNVPTVKYPEKYSLQSDKDKRQEAKDLQESTKAHPSVTYKKEVYKIVANSLIGPNISRETLDKINQDIEQADVIVSDPEELRRDIELGLIDPETASLAKAYPKGVVEKAKEAHAERVARIAESQAKARGANDLGGIDNASRSEKIDKDEDLVASTKTRGEA